jgi:hypothetical protein
VAYRQFCQHFLAPLALSARRDPRLVQLLRSCLDGLPLDLVSPLLPRRTWLDFGLLSHVHLHARSQALFKEPRRQRAARTVPKTAVLGLVDSLEAAVRRLRWDPPASTWSDYEETHAYSAVAFAEKKKAVERALRSVRPATVFDLGANTGVFSRIARQSGAFTVSFDFDASVVETNYRRARAEKDEGLLPLVMDLSNPSPGLGWAGEERGSLSERGPADVVLALALVHHLAIGNNVPLARVARYFARLGRQLVVEWIPKDDPQVQRLLESREDVFAGYTREAFEAAFASSHTLESAADLGDSGRRLYHFKSRG